MCASFPLISNEWDQQEEHRLHKNQVSKIYPHHCLATKVAIDAINGAKQSLVGTSTEVQEHYTPLANDKYLWQVKGQPWLAAGIVTIA